MGMATVGPGGTGGRPREGGGRGDTEKWRQIQLADFLFH